MQLYTIEITETLQKQIKVLAENQDKAIEIAQDVYYSGDEILNENDLKETTFERLYDLNGSNYTIKQLRESYREITGLDNDDEYTDEEIYNYMLETIEEG